MAESIHTRYHSFERVELSEPDYQSLIASLASRLFPGYHWFPFSPPVESPYGVAHPDAALIGEAEDSWWVVEVELARHGIEAHVDLQLRKLRDGWYGRRHFDHLMERSPDAGALLGRLSPSHPQFLVLVDDRSTLIERAARDNDFDLLHVLPFRSVDQDGLVLYATCVEGRNPLRRARRSAGFAVSAEATGGVVRLRVTEGAAQLPSDAGKVLVGNRLVRAWVERDQRGLVLALGVEELHVLVGTAPYYWLTTDAREAMRVSAIER